MTHYSETRKIHTKEKEWDKALSQWDYFWYRVRKELKYDFKSMMDFLMYYKKPTDRAGRFVHGFEWWLAVIVIFFAIKGITYWLIGR